jgi:hypothetical protein
VIPLLRTARDQGPEKGANVNDDIYSPPFPNSPLMKAEALYRLCDEFREWLKVELSNIHADAGLECCQKPLRSLPKMEQFLNLGFIQHASIFMALRQLREVYDSIVRNHDDNWTSKVAIRLRHMAAQEGILILEYAFLPREILEAKLESIEEDYVKQQQGHFQAMFDLLMGKKKKEIISGETPKEGGYRSAGGDEFDAEEAT